MANAPALRKTRLGDKRDLGEIPTRDNRIAITRTFEIALEQAMGNVAKKGPDQIKVESVIATERRWENEEFRSDAARYCLRRLYTETEPSKIQVLVKTILRLVEHGAIGEFVAPETAYLTNMKIAEWCRQLTKEKPELAHRWIGAAQTLVAEENRSSLGYTSQYGTFFIRLFCDDNQMRTHSEQTGFISVDNKCTVRETFLLTHDYEIELMGLIKRKWKQIAGELGYKVYFNLSTGRWEDVVDSELFAVELLRRITIHGLSFEREMSPGSIDEAIIAVNQRESVLTSIIETLRLRTLGNMYLQEMFEPWLDNHNSRRESPYAHPNSKTAQTMVAAYLRCTKSPKQEKENGYIAEALRGVALAVSRLEDVTSIFETSEDSASAIKQGVTLGIVPEGLMEILEAKLREMDGVVKRHGEPELLKTQVTAAMEVARNIKQLNANLAPVTVTLSEYGVHIRNEGKILGIIDRLVSEGLRLPKHEMRYLASQIYEIGQARGQNTALLGTAKNNVFEEVTEKLNMAAANLRIKSGQ